MPGDIYFLYLYFYIEHTRVFPVNVSSYHWYPSGEQSCTPKE